ncbi:MAG: acyloxyacyl hydrolase [Thermoanaerobaculia bacterium]|nr:acyloxyacyl hydrolase [Thermoanaerobaculia bacterium]
MRCGWIVGASVLVLGSFLGLEPVGAQEAAEPWFAPNEWSQSHRWVTGMGVFGLRKNDPRSEVVDVEYRWPNLSRGVYPLAGVMINTADAVHLRFGFGLNAEIADRWDVTLSGAAGYYHRGDSKELGQGMEFRTAVDLSYEVSPRARLALTLGHFSNGGLSRLNPGVENLSLSLIFRP